MSDKARGDWWADKAAELERERNDWMDYAKALKAENESLRKDAERYRRIREGYLLDGEIYMLDRRGCMYEEEACLLDGEELDKAVDAAISSPEKP